MVRLFVFSDPDTTHSPQFQAPPGKSLCRLLVPPHKPCRGIPIAIIQHLPVVDALSAGHAFGSITGNGVKSVCISSSVMRPISASSVDASIITGIRIFVSSKSHGNAFWNTSLLPPRSVLLRFAQRSPPGTRTPKICRRQRFLKSISQL